MVATTSEELTQLAPSSDIGIVAQEAIHLEEFDLYLVLDFSPGPGHEVASYAHIPSFVERSIIFYLRKYDPSQANSYPSAVIKQFPNCVPIDDLDIEECTLVAAAVFRAEAKRNLAFKQQNAE